MIVVGTRRQTGRSFEGSVVGFLCDYAHTRRNNICIKLIARLWLLFRRGVFAFAFIWLFTLWVVDVDFQVAILHNHNLLVEIVSTLHRSVSLPNWWLLLLDWFASFGFLFLLRSAFRLLRSLNFAFRFGNTLIAFKACQVAWRQVELYFLLRFFGHSVIWTLFDSQILCFSHYIIIMNLLKSKEWWSTLFNM